jgi:hypothetical protein
VYAGFYGFPGSFGFGVRAGVAVDVCIGGTVGTSCVDVVYTLKSRALRSLVHYLVLLGFS